MEATAISASDNSAPAALAKEIRLRDGLSLVVGLSSVARRAKADDIIGELVILSEAPKGCIVESLPTENSRRG